MALPFSPERSYGPGVLALHRRQLDDSKTLIYAEF